MNFYASIGIKQVVRYEWMHYTIELLKSGLNRNEIRNELNHYLSTKKGSGETAQRAEYTMSMAVALLLKIWINPQPKLLMLRNNLLEFANNKALEPICHWAMFAAAYPFWFTLSYILGSLFKLQDRIKKSQIIDRMYKIFGERNTVERCSRYVISSFAAWEIIIDKEKSGYYEKGKLLQLSDIGLMALLIEAMLHAVPQKRLCLADIVNCPAFFNMKLPVINGSQIEKTNPRLFFERFSLNDEYVGLRI